MTCVYAGEKCYVCGESSKGFISSAWTQSCLFYRAIIRFLFGVLSFSTFIDISTRLLESSVRVNAFTPERNLMHVVNHHKVSLRSEHITVNSEWSAIFEKGMFIFSIVIIVILRSSYFRILSKSVAGILSPVNWKCVYAGEKSYVCGESSKGFSPEWTQSLYLTV